MKKLILIFFSFIFFSSQLLSQTEWTEIIYHYQTGSVPPPYFYSYDIRLSSTGIGSLIYYPDYSKDTFWLYDLTLSEEDLRNLNSSVVESKIMTEKIPSLPDNKKPIGGSLQNLTITLYQDPNLDQVPPSITTPYFPEEQYKEALEKLYSAVKNFVPNKIWKELEQKKEDYIKEKK